VVVLLVQNAAPPTPRPAERSAVTAANRSTGHRYRMAAYRSRAPGPVPGSAYRYRAPVPPREPGHRYRCPVGDPTGTDIRTPSSRPPRIHPTPQPRPPRPTQPVTICTVAGGGPLNPRATGTRMVRPRSATVAQADQLRVIETNAPVLNRTVASQVPPALDGPLPRALLLRSTESEHRIRSGTFECATTPRISRP
jgi:hypothetical protein